MSELSASDRDILRAVFNRTRAKLIDLLDGVGAGPAERAKAFVALNELNAAIEGVPVGPVCPVCGRPIEAHDPREIHDCAVEARTAKLVEAVRIVQTPLEDLVDDELPENVIPVEFRGAVRAPRNLLDIPKE